MSNLVQLVSPLERALYLKTVPFFNGLEASELATLASTSEEVQVVNGKLIADPNTPVDAFYLIVSGSVSIEGSEFPERSTIGAGEGFGFLSSVTNAGRGLDAHALEGCVLLRFSTAALLDLMESHFYVLHGLLSSLARQVLLERKAIADGTFLGARESTIPDVERDLTTVERALALAGSSEFQRGQQNLLRLVRNQPERRFPAGTQLWTAGDPAGKTFMLLSGHVRAVQRGNRATFICGAGYPLGNLESLAEANRWFDAITDTPVRALEINHENFMDAIEDDFIMGEEFLKLMAQNLIRIRWENHQKREIAELDEAATAG